MKKTILFVAALAGAGALSAQEAAPSAAEILAKVDSNQAFTSISYSGTMEIHQGERVRSKTMTAVAQGKEKAFVEFSNPEDRGTRYLKLGDDLWMYFPKEDDKIKISGALLRQGMMGSDVSYEEAMESDRLTELYAAALSGSGTVGDRPVWVLDLVAKRADAAYAKRSLKIDKERFVVLEASLFASSGKLLKTSRTLSVESIGGRWFPTSSEVVDETKRGSRTVFSMKDVNLNPKIDPARFSLDGISK